MVWNNYYTMHKPRLIDTHIGECYYLFKIRMVTGQNPALSVSYAHRRVFVFFVKSKIPFYITFFLSYLHLIIKHSRDSQFK